MLIRMTVDAMRRWIHLPLALCCGSLPVAPLHAQCVADMRTRLTASGGGGGDSFGRSLALHNDLAIVSALGGDNFEGVAYIFRRTGSQWIQEARLASPDPANVSVFGTAVSIGADVAVVATDWAFVGDVNAGIAVVYEFDGAAWLQTAALRPSDPPGPGLANSFGEAVAIHGDVILVGAPGDGQNGLLAGAVYAFHRPPGGWVDMTETSKFVSADGRAEDFFGQALALRGNRALIGAPQSNNFPDDFPGRAFIFEFDGNTWQPQAELSATDGVTDDWFGSTVALDDTAALIGALGNNGAYVFRLSNGQWAQEQKLTPDADESFWGYSVALQSDIAAIGWPWGGPPNPDGTSPGQVDVFLRTTNGWERQFGLTDSNDPGDSSIGVALAVSSDTLLVGDTNTLSDGQGAIYLFNVGTGSADCNGNGVADACDIVAGISRDCDLDSEPDECQPPPPPPAQGAELLPADPVNLAYFGWSVAISGDVAVAGAPNDDDRGPNTGAAYVYRFDGTNWVYEAKLLGGDTVSYDFFGFAVAAHGDLIVVGATGDNDGGGDSGSAYVFRYANGQWSEEAKLTASDAVADAAFGSSLATDGVRLLIGATYDRGFRGAAYVYRRSAGEWIAEGKLVAADAALHDEFAFSVAIDGDVAVCGAHFEDESANGAGAAYVFRFDGTQWVQERKLLAPGGAAFDYFGSSVAVSGDAAIVGAIRGTVDGQATGAAYVYRSDGAGDWPFETRLTAADPRILAWFGCSAALVGETAVIGSYAADVPEIRSGAVYMFRRDGGIWRQTAKLMPSDPEWSQAFGFSVSLDGGRVLVGARTDTSAGVQAGAAYVYGSGFADCNANGYPDACDIDSGASADANANGVPDECEAPQLPGDVDGDCDVDLQDLTTLLANFGTTEGATHAQGDLDDDGDVELADLALLLAQFGQTCP